MFSHIDPKHGTYIRRRDVDADIESGVLKMDSECPITVVTKIECDICGDLNVVSGAEWEVKEVREDGRSVGTLFLPDKGPAGFALVGDAEDYLALHIQEKHPGKALVIYDGQTMRVRRKYKREG